MITLVRHGRTASNARGLLLGHADPPLDSLGERQAAAVARALPPVDRVLSSPLRRAAQTATSIATGHGVAAEIAESLIELDYGDWDQRPVGDVTAQEWRRWQQDLDWAPPNGESLRHLGERVRRLLDSLTAVAVEEHVVLVTHVSPLKAAVAWALGVGDETSWRMFVQPASITRIGLGRAAPSLQCFNDVGHLEGLDS